MTERETGAEEKSPTGKSLVKTKRSGISTESEPSGSRRIESGVKVLSEWVSERPEIEELNVWVVVILWCHHMELWAENGVQTLLVYRFSNEGHSGGGKDGGIKLKLKSETRIRDNNGWT